MRDTGLEIGGENFCFSPRLSNQENERRLTLFGTNSTDREIGWRAADAFIRRARLSVTGLSLLGLATLGPVSSAEAPAGAAICRPMVGSSKALCRFVCILYSGYSRCYPNWKSRRNNLCPISRVTGTALQPTPVAEIQRVPRGDYLLGGSDEGIITINGWEMGCTLMPLPPDYQSHL
jgi:hypothetical protein